MLLYFHLELNVALEKSEASWRREEIKSSIRGKIRNLHIWSLLILWDNVSVLTIWGHLCQAHNLFFAICRFKKNFFRKLFFIYTFVICSVSLFWFSFWWTPIMHIFDLLWLSSTSIQPSLAILLICISLFVLLTSIFYVLSCVFIVFINPVLSQILSLF